MIISDSTAFHIYTQLTINETIHIVDTGHPSIHVLT